MTREPRIVAHADWSTDSGKRWYAIAELRDDVYVVGPPARVGEVAEYFPRLLAVAGPEGGVLAGFDFPIGIPEAYARLAGIAAFLPTLPQFGRGPWADFYQVAATAAEVGIRQPFYPRAPGGKKQAHLVDALGVVGMGQLLRQCDRATPRRNAACPLFWTLGGNQVGRGAISGWRDLLAPALHAYGGRVGIWPFDGSLKDLLASRLLVVVETYPKDQYAHLNFPARGWSKRNAEDRKARAPQITAWAEDHAGRVRLAPALAEEIANGFGPGGAGEDAFDATVGLTAMLSVVLGDRPDGAPDSSVVREVEGWIFGQQPGKGAMPNPGRGAQVASRASSLCNHCPPRVTIPACGSRFTFRR